MWVSARIKNYLGKLADDALFSTRDLLNFGKRGAVDITLFRMAKGGEIERLTWGVYRKKKIGVEREISETEVAHAKAAAFGKRIMPHEADVACDLKLSDRRPEQTTFETDGRSTRFCFLKTSEVIHFRGVSARKMRLGNGKVARCIRALWHLPAKLCTPSIIKSMAASLGRSERRELETMCRWMPSRISDWIIDFRYGAAPPPVYEPAPSHSTVNEILAAASIYKLRTPA